MKKVEKSKQGFFSRKWGKEITISFNYDKKSISRFVHHLLTEIAPKDLFTQNSLKDLKGRDKQNLLLNTFSERQLPTSDEFLYIETESIREKEAEPIVFEAHSHFESFEGTHHISHSVRPNKKNFPFSELKPELLAFIAPLSVKAFRFGLEGFSSTYTTLSLGYTPTVTESIIIDCNDGEGKVSILSENRNKKEDLPFEERGSAKALLRLLETIFE